MAVLAPSNFTPSATVVKPGSAVTLSWSGAGGVMLVGYDLAYCDSANGTTWGSWSSSDRVVTTSTSGSRSMATNPTAGAYRKYRIRTAGSLNGGETSSWLESVSVRTNLAPTAPTVFTASPTTYSSGSITLAWSNAVKGSSAIKNYVLQVASSTDNIAWSAYSALATVTTTATSGSYSYTPGTMSSFTRYRVCVTDALDVISGYTVSNVVRKNSPPPSPAVTAPKAGAVTYNTQPRIIITTGIEPDGNRQMVCLKTAEGEWLDSVNNPESFSPSGWFNNNTATTFTHPALIPGSKTISVKSKDEGIQAESTELSVSFTIAPSPFTPIIPNETPVKAEHITALRSAANNVRNYYGLTAVVWSESIIPGRTQIKNWTYHILELRKAVEQVTDAIDWIRLSPGRPKAAVMEQLHLILLNL